MRVNSLAFRLFLTSIVWTLLVLPIAGVLIYTLYRNDVQASFDGQLRKLVTAIRIDSLYTGSAHPIAPTNRYEPLFEVTHSGWYWQIRPVKDAQGRELVSVSLGTAALPSPFAAHSQEVDGGIRWMNSKGPVGEPVRIVEVIDTLQTGNGEGPTYSIIVAGPLEWFEDGVAKFRNRLTTALALAGLGLVIATWLQVGFGLAPLRKIERGLAQIRSGEAVSLEGTFPAEIEPLQSEINALLDSNQKIIDRARTQVGNLAHALKTPLAVITNEARETKAPIGKKVNEQAEVMRQQIAHYLDRARIAARVDVIGRVTDVQEVVAPLVRALERIHQDKDVRIHVACPEGARFQGEKHDLEEMLGNLLDNACKWTKKNVYLTVKASAPTARTQSRRVIITVEDDGPGLTREQREQICQRGTRLDESKPGSGLGLSIVSDLSQSYRGSFELDHSTRGGLLARLDLPAV